MISRRLTLALLAAAIASPLRAAVRPAVVVHRSPTCGCCGAWANYLRRAGFSVTIINEDDLAPVKLRVGLPDYVLVFRKFPLDNAKEVNVIHDPRDTTYFGENRPQMLLDIPGRKGGKSAVSLPVWQNYADPIWDDVRVPAIWQDINQTNVLNYEIAKEDSDERHICPLQLDLIARLIQWYTNEGEVVFDPFAGVGSTLYQAVKLKRKGLGVELKPSYWKWAQKYIGEAEFQNGQKTLFDLDKLTFSQPIEGTRHEVTQKPGKTTPAENGKGTQAAAKKAGKAKRKADAAEAGNSSPSDETRPLEQAVVTELPI